MVLSLTFFFVGGRLLMWMLTDSTFIPFLRIFVL